METPATVRRNPPRRAKMSSCDKTTAVEYTSTRKRVRSAVKGKSLMPSFTATEGDVAEGPPEPKLQPCRMKDLDEQTKTLNVEAPHSELVKDEKNDQVSPNEEARANDDDPTRASVQFDTDAEIQSLRFFPDQIPSSFDVSAEAGLTSKPALEKIRVFLRIRPAKVVRSGKVTKKAPKQGDMVNRSIQNWKKPSAAEAKSANEAPEVCLFPQTSDSVSLIPPTSVSGPRRSKAEEFNGFTHIFTPDATQEEVFDKIVHPRLVDLLKGQSSLVVAMGPTSAGKTHTMLGTGEDVGLLPRSLRFLLKDNQDINSASIRIAISMFEIYSDQQARSERLIDLLQDGVELSLLQFKIKGLHEAFVSSIEEADSVLLSGLKRRTTASTAANDRSSRSHCIINISANVPKDCEGQDDVIYLKKATLTIADLAGFEREKKTGNQGVRLNESSFINNTSMIFGQCLRALLEHQKNPKKLLQKHFQYSMLTRYLKPYMEARGNMTLIVNVSPCEEDYLDTAFVLRQAAPYTSIKVILPPKEVAEKPKEVEKRGIPIQEGQPINKRRKVDGIRKLGSRNAIPVNLSLKRSIKGHNLGIRISSQDLNTSTDEQTSKTILDTVQDDVIEEISPLQTPDDNELRISETDPSHGKSDKEITSLSDFKQMVVTAVENVLLSEKIENAAQLSQNIFDVFDKAVKQHFNIVKEYACKSTIEQKGSNKSIVSPSKENNNQHENTQSLEDLKRYSKDLENELAMLKQQHLSELEKIKKMSALHPLSVMEATLEPNNFHTQKTQVPSQIDQPFSSTVVAYDCENIREHCDNVTEMVDDHNNPGITDICVHTEDVEMCRVGNMSQETDYDKLHDKDQPPEISEGGLFLNDIMKPGKQDNMNSVSNQECTLNQELMSCKSKGNIAADNLHKSVAEDEIMLPTTHEVVIDFQTAASQDELMAPISTDAANDFDEIVPQDIQMSPTIHGSMCALQVSDSEGSPTCSTTQLCEQKLQVSDSEGSPTCSETQHDERKLQVIDSEGNPTCSTNQHDEQKLQVNDSEGSPTCSTTHHDEQKLHTEDDIVEKQLTQSNIKLSTSHDMSNGFQEEIISSTLESEYTSRIGTTQACDHKLQTQEIKEEEELIVVSMKSSYDNLSSAQNELMSPTSNCSEHDLQFIDSEEKGCNKTVHQAEQPKSLHMVEECEDSPQIDTIQHKEESPDNQCMHHSNQFQSLHVGAVKVEELTKLQAADGKDEDDIQKNSSAEGKDTLHVGKALVKLQTAEENDEDDIQKNSSAEGKDTLQVGEALVKLQTAEENDEDDIQKNSSADRKDTFRVGEALVKLQTAEEKDEDDIQKNSSAEEKDTVNDQYMHSCKKPSIEVEDILVESVVHEKLMSPTSNDYSRHRENLLSTKSYDDCKQDIMIQHEESENVVKELHVQETKKNTTGTPTGSDLVVKGSPILVNDSKAHALVLKEASDRSESETCAAQVENIGTPHNKKQGKSLLKGKLLALSLFEEYKVSAESVKTVDQVDDVTNASMSLETLGPIGHELEEILEVRLVEIEKEIWNHSNSCHSKLSDLLKKMGGILDINSFPKKHSKQRSQCIRFCLAVISGKINLGGRWLELSKENEASRKRHFYAIVQARTVAEASGHARSGFEEEARFNSVSMEEFGEQLEAEEKENKNLSSPAKAAPKRRKLQPLSSLAFQTGSSLNSDYDYTAATADDHPIKVSNDEHVDGGMSWKKSSSLANLLLHRRK